MARFVRIAKGYDTMALTLAVTGLEGAGFTVLTPGRHLNSIMPGTSTALGAVPILVPERDAGDAITFLQAIATEGVKVLDRPEYLPGQDPASFHPDPQAKKGWFTRLWHRLFLPVARSGPARNRDSAEN